MEDSQWSKDTSKWAWVNDSGLQQARTVQHATWENHNKFGAKMLRTKRSTNFCKHWFGGATLSLAYSNPRLESQIGDCQSIIEQTNPSSTC